MPVTLDLVGLDRITAKMRSLGHMDATPLMLTWMGIIESDNRKGVLAGLDKDGIPLRPVTYRPKAAPQEVTKKQRLNQRKNARGEFAGFGPYVSGLHNSLSGSEYRLLGGPPLAPRRAFSRVITNLVTTYGGNPESNHWYAAGAWDEVVSRKGIPFLHWHFEGTGKLPKRDLRGVRPEGVTRARAALRAWAIDQIRSA